MADDDGTPAGPLAPAAAGGVTPVRSRPRGRARVRYLSGRVRRVLRNRWDVLLVIAAGGALGSLARWGLTLALPHPAGAFPWATFVANASGCGLLGLLMVFVLELWPPSRYVRPFLGVGVLGGYTTFSSAMLDARALLVAGRPAVAGEYVFGSLAAGLVAVWCGAVLGRLAVRGAGRRRRAGHRDEPGDPSAGDVRSTPSMTRSRR